MAPAIEVYWQWEVHKITVIIDNVAINEFNYRAWRFITSFIDHAIQIYVGQKATENPRENRWRVSVLEEFLLTALLYQATNTRNTSCTQTIVGSL